MPFWNWRDQYRFGLAALALFQALAHAHDRRQPEFQRGLRPLEHRLIGLAEVLAALAVADDGVRGARGRDHGTGNLAGEGAFLGPGDILRADADGAALSGVDGRGKDS